MIDRNLMRMNKDFAAKFEALRREFMGLPPSSIARMALTAFLNLPLHEQVRIIEAQVRHPGAPMRRPSREGINTKARLRE